MIKINGVPYLPIDEYANEKGKTVQTIYNWIKEKKIETKNMMGKVLIKL